MPFFETLEKALKINVREHAKNGSWLAFGSIIASLLSLGISVIYANFLSKETYGEYRYILSLLNTFNSISLSGMSIAVAQAVARGLDGTLAIAIRSQLKWAIPHGLAGLVAAAVFFVLGNTEVAICLSLIAITVPVTNAFNTYSAFLQGRKAFKALSIATILQSLAVYGSIAFAVFFTENVIWMTFANITSTLISSLGVRFWARKTLILNTEKDDNAVPYGRRLSILWGLRLAAEQIDTLLIHAFLGPAQLAVYAVTISIPDRLKGYIKIIPTISLPNHANRTLAEIVPPLRKKLLALATIMGIASIIYAISSPLLFKWVYPQYQDAVLLTQLYSMTFIFGLWGIPLGVLFSQRESKALNAIFICSSLLQGIVMAIGLYCGELLGVIVAKLLIQGLQMIIAVIGLEFLLHKQKKDSRVRG